MICAQLGKTLVVQAANSRGSIAIFFVPERIDAEHLQVDAHAVHGLETRGELLTDLQEMLRHTFNRWQDALGLGTHQVKPPLKVTMRMRIDGARALATNNHRRPSCRRRATAIRHDGQARATAKPEATAARHM